MDTATGPDETSTMRACVVHGAGDLRVDEVPWPAPGPGQVAIDVAYGGVCGSDLHYVRDGGIGDFPLREPMVLGHEVSGTVAALGDGVTGLSVGDGATVYPASPCHACPECLDGRENVCRDTRYLGSSMRYPHTQGGFAQRILVRPDQVIPLPPGLDLRRAALAEPLAVALHAVRRAGDVAGKRVLVTGAGPIGALVVAALRHAGAGEIVVSDLVEQALAIAAAVGATRTVRADAVDPASLEVDVAVDASGAPAGVNACAQALVRGGRLVLLGILPAGLTPFAGNLVVTRELEVAGAFRFSTEIRDAVAMLAAGLDVEAVISHVIPLTEASRAIELAQDRTTSSKVLLDLQA
ncbi:L-idonate 5-dehydrogenase [Agilicoccus flavus]|uniref:L-idonate 5-dehydrogenase n=1 Tax=Agilicoccus flavus TaxID=2775968 RepID=UPI001CF6702A|nr:L-idonate 5-dehydrogenase [Agilicoccus flavus]